MKRLQPLLLCIIIAGATGFTIQPAYAQNKKATTLEQATKIVKEQDKARVLSAKTKQENGKEVHQVKILDSKGHVRTVKVPAKEK